MKVLLKILAICFSAQTWAVVAQTTTITFDDLPASIPPVPPPGTYPAVPAGYHGFQWFNFEVADETDSPILSGAINGIVSPKNVVFNARGNPADFSSAAAFDLNSAYLTAIWNDGLQVEVQGFAGTTLIYDNIYTINTSAPVLENFNYIGVTEVNFISSGGTHNPAYGGGAGTQFAMDNLTVTTIPEPGILGLLLSSAFVFFLKRNRTNV